MAERLRPLSAAERLLRSRGRRLARLVELRTPLFVIVGEARLVDQAMNLLRSENPALFAAAEKAAVIPVRSPHDGREACDSAVGERP